MAGAGAIKAGNNMRKLSRNQLAYLAGLIDGEGCIGIAKCRKEPTPNNPTPLHLCVSLSIGMTDGDLLESLAEETGLGFTRLCESTRPGWRPRTDWRLSSKACRQLLPALLPYLRLKKPQAKLVLRYLRLASHKPVWNARNGKHDVQYKQHATYIKRVLGIYEDLKRLNKKGTN